jgi:hypothetical protein
MFQASYLEAWRHGTRSPGADAGANVQDDCVKGLESCLLGIRPQWHMAMSRLMVAERMGR